jgi:uncharacterized protein
MHPISIRYAFRPRQRSLATGRVVDLFGIHDEEPAVVIADQLCLDIRPGDVVLFTGPSGSGKSSLLRAAGEQLNALDAGALTLPDRPLVDCLAGPVKARLDKLAAAGLSEARLLLRTPSELSDGQRYRFRLAYVLNELASRPSSFAPRFLLADEFAAILDRTLAKVLAFNIRKLATRTGIGVLLATTHDDLLDDLNPDLWVRCLGDGQIDCQRRDVKKKPSASPATFGFPRGPRPTGRTSLGGITGATSSLMSAGSCSSGTRTIRSASAFSARRPPRCGSAADTSG